MLNVHYYLVYNDKCSHDSSVTIYNSDPVLIRLFMKNGHSNHDKKKIKKNCNTFKTLDKFLKYILSRETIWGGTKKTSSN